MHAVTIFMPLQEGTDPWDRYSRQVGHAARKALLAAFATYPGRYTFPPPFNILCVLIWFPCTIARLLGSGVTYATKAEILLWRCVVGPFMAIVAILFSGPLTYITYIAR